MESKHLSVVIERSPQQVYDYAAEPDHLPLWASGLAQAEVERDGDRLTMQSPMGSVTVIFSPRNTYGVLDHDVTLPGGEVVANPVRVVAHPDGAEIVFTVRQRDLSESKFEQDASTVMSDLRRLKELVESDEKREKKEAP